MSNAEITAVRDAHRFDEGALARYLADTLEGFSTLDHISQFSGGQSNPTFLIESGASRWVLRKQPPGKLLRGAHLVHREYQAMSALAGSGVPVPETRLLCTDAAIIGTDFYVMDFVDGDVFTDPALPDRTASQRRDMFRALATVLARLHQIEPAAVGLETFGKPDGYTARQIHVWSRQYEAAKTDQNDDMDQLISALPARLPEEPPTGIVHGDYRMGNVLWDSGEPMMVAVLDWELATLGHAWVDLAHCAMMYATPSVSESLPGVGDDPPEGIPAESAFIDRYCAERDIEPPDDWDFYVSMALFRMASICQGVYARSLQGNASDPTASRYGEIAKVLATLSRERLG